MTNDDLLLLIDAQYNIMLSLTRSKGAEYARSNTDQLANFKRQGEELGSTPEQILMVYLNKHVDSIKTYVKRLGTGQPVVLSEPIEGRIDDAILYLVLFKGLTRDRESKNSPGLIEPSQ